ncbi:MAG: NAD(P)H-hydrate dehydratase [Variovorax sp.]|nr:MAG: NAD(P)H-hydrate dehydratase [Variovorax sp.]
MHRISSAFEADLHDVAATRRIEHRTAAGLPAHALMQRAGLAVARLAGALAPHARSIWIACGPGNNGGDGLEAAAWLRRRGVDVLVTWLGDERRLPPDAAASLARARAAGVVFAARPPDNYDLAIDALLGIGATRPPEGAMAEWLWRMSEGPAPVLCVDVPSGLDADTGHLVAGPTAATPQAAGSRRHCLSLLTLKPGLFTAHGRDAAGEVWFDDLDCPPGDEAPVARLAGAPAPRMRAHATNKGSHGDVAVVGGAAGMAGAPLLAATAALHAGAGRVFVAPLDGKASMLDASRPELMFRRLVDIRLETVAVVCGCGGGDAVRTVLPRILAQTPTLVLDADALNAVAGDASLRAAVRRRAARGWRTVLTPHPLEAARLLGTDVGEVQADRLAAALRLALDYGCVAVLKGSGTVVAAPDETIRINPTGNGLLATAGTGDVLAGMVGAALAAGRPALEAACAAVWRHGDIADRWPAHQPLTAGALAMAV